MAEKPTLNEYRAWKAATFGPYDWIQRFGFNPTSVASLTGEKRTRAIQLFECGAESGEGHAARGLAAMESTASLPMLRDGLEKAKGEDRVLFAQAIHELSLWDSDDGAREGGVMAEDPMARELITVLEGADTPWQTQCKAALALQAFRDQKSEEALLRTVERDGQYVLRNTACNSLLNRWVGVGQKNISAHPEIDGLIRALKEGDKVMDRVERGKEAVRLMKELKLRGMSDE